jgi:hypothetical protein
MEAASIHEHESRITSQTGPQPTSYDPDLRRRLFGMPTTFPCFPISDEKIRYTNHIFHVELIDKSSSFLSVLSFFSLKAAEWREVER